MSRLPPPKSSLYLGASPSRSAASGKDDQPLAHTLTMAGLSDIGRVRKRNEDSLAWRPTSTSPWWRTGWGATPAGTWPAASRRNTRHGVSRTLLPHARIRHLRRVSPRPCAPPWPNRSWAHISAIRTEGVRNPSLDGMGTTLTALAVDPETGACALGPRRRLPSLPAAGRHSSNRSPETTPGSRPRWTAAQLTREQARRHPFGHILTQCLGLADAPEPQSSWATVQRGRPLPPVHGRSGGHAGGRRRSLSADADQLASGEPRRGR